MKNVAEDDIVVIVVVDDDDELEVDFGVVYLTLFVFAKRPC